MEAAVRRSFTKRCSEKYRKIHQGICFNKVADLQLN